MFTSAKLPGSVKCVDNDCRQVGTVVKLWLMPRNLVLVLRLARQWIKQPSGNGETNS